MIARKSFLIIFSQFLLRFLGWIGLWILARKWGGFAPEALGTIGFAMSFLAIFNIFADLGFSRAHVKRISEGKDLGTCIGTFVAIKTTLIGLMLIIIFISIYVWKTLLGGGFYDATTESVIFVFILYYVILNLQQVVTYTFEGTKEIAKRQISLIFEGVLKVPSMIIIALAGVIIAERINILPSLDWPNFLKPIQNFLAVHAIGSLAMTYVIGAAGPLIVGLLLMRKYPLKRPDWQLFKSYFHFALPITLMSVIGIISVNIDKIMIGYFWTATEVGYYFTIQQILQFLTIIYMSVGIVLFPALSEYHAHNNFKKLRETTLLAERYISMVIVPPIILIIVFSSTIIDIMLSSAFLPASTALIILTLYTYLYSRNTAYGSLIGGINRPDISAKVSILICCVNIILNYFFIPKDGLLTSIGISGPNGAAVATVLSIFVGFVAIRIAVFRLIKIHVLDGHTPLHLVAGTIMAFILYLFGLIVNVNRWHHLIIFGLCGLAIYLLVLCILKEFKKQDFYFFLDVFHLKKMVNYIKYELKNK